MALGAAGRQSAFTLLELLIVLAIASLLLAAAQPDMQQTLAARELRATSADLLAAINQARAQAIARRRVVTLLAEDGDWNHGWRLLIDSNANRQPDAGEQVLARRSAPARGLRIRSRFTDPTTPRYIAYNAVGRSCRAAHPNAANFGTITVEIDGARRNIKINMQGRARLCDPAQDPATCASV